MSQEKTLSLQPKRSVIEYTTRIVAFNQPMESQLAAAGADGWDLCFVHTATGVNPATTLFFKRRAS